MNTSDSKQASRIRLRKVFLASFVLIGLAACGGPAPQEPQVVVSPSTVTIAPGGVQVFTASVVGIADSQVEWSASSGHIETDGSTATFTAPESSGDFTVVATSVARPRLAGVANVSVRTTDQRSVVKLQVSPEALTLESSGAMAELTVTGYDERGFEVTLDASQLEWLVSDPSVVSLVPGVANANLESLVELGSSILAVRLASNPGVQSAPVAITVAKLHPDVARLTDDRIVFPPPRTWHENTSAWRDVPDVVKTEGGVYIGGFNAEEVAALYGVPEQFVLRYPVVIRGEPPARGQVVYSTEGAVVMGRVVRAEARGEFSLLEVEQVGVQDVFSQLDFEFDGEALSAAGILAPQFKGSLDPSLSVQSLDECEVSGSWDIADVKSIAALESTVVWTTRIKWDDAILPHEFYVGIRFDMTFTTSFGLRPGVRGKVVCPVGRTKTATVPVGGPVAGLLDPAVTARPMLEIAIRGTVGPSMEVSAEYDFSVEFGAGRLCQPDCENTAKAEINSTSFDGLQFSSSTNPGNASIGLSVGVYWSSELGVQVGGGVLVGACEGVSWIPIVNTACNKVLNATFLDLMKGKIGAELAMDLDSPARVLVNEGSGSEAALNAIVEMSLENKHLNELLQMVGHTPASFKFADVEVTLLPLYRTLEAGSITVNGEVYKVPSSSLPVAIGSSLSIVLEGSRQTDAHWVPGFLRSNLQDGEVWIGRNVRWDDADVRAEGDGLVVQLLVTEALCEHAIDGVVTVNFLGNDNMLGAVPVSTFLGQLRLECPDEPIAPSIVRVTPDPVSASNSQQWLTIDGAGFEPASAVTLRSGTQAFLIPAARTEFVSAGRLRVLVNVGNQAGDWSAEVRNPSSGQVSPRYNFSVVAVEPTLDADLVVRNLVVTPTEAQPGSEATIAFAIANQGEATAGQSLTRLRLNDDPTDVKGSDVLLVEIVVPPIAGGEERSYEQVVLLPTELVGGTYYLWVIADVFNEVEQSDFSNDRAVAELTVTTPFEPCASGDPGNAAAPCELISVQQLQAVATNLSGHYVLGGDIDASSTASWNMGRGFMPIGSDESSFTGTLDGQGFTISGLTIDRLGNELAGLFAVVGSQAEIANLHIVGGAISSAGPVGAVAGMNFGTLYNVSQSAQVSGQANVGGVVGINSGSVSLAINTGTIVGIELVGGVVGHNLAGGQVIGARNAGPVQGRASVGGVVGLATGGLISDAYNEAQVIGEDSTGGILGLGEVEVTIEMARNAGTVNGVDYTGGIAGLHQGVTSGASNSGSITGNDYVGGIAGLYQGTINSASNSGSVEGSDYIGGIVGLGGDGAVTAVANSGQVTGWNSVGGLLGLNGTGAISTSFNTAPVRGEIHVGGLVGISQGNVESSYSIGRTEGTSLVGGIVGILAGDAVIIHAYSAGPVIAAADEVGAIVGSMTVPERLIGTYYDTTTTGRPDTDAGEGWSTAQMRQQSTYVGWDFPNTWSILSGVDYPDLVANPR